MENKTLTKQAWSLVHEKALEIANAAMRDDELMAGIHVEQMQDLLDDMETEYGTHAMLTATRADYLIDPAERRALYEVALILAKEKGDHAEVAEIRDTLEKLPDA